MRYTGLFSGLLALASASPAGHDSPYQRCHEVEPSAEFRQKTSGIQEPFSAAAAPVVINVKTYAHVVTTKARKGDFSQAQINKQIAVMNKSYKPANIKFTLVDTDYTVNDAWAKASPQSDAEVAMKNALHKNTYAALNLYFLSDLDAAGGGTLLGFCPFPYTDIDPNNPAYTPYIKYDGCILLADSVPGGSAAPYNLGYTAVHEIGHWFGAYHVFQGNSCSGDGDYVDDTPYQTTPSSGCPTGKDTCPSAGLDSIHNYMDYSDDACMNQFTAGQRSRIRAIYQAFRKCNGAC